MSHLTALSNRQLESKRFRMGHNKEAAMSLILDYNFCRIDYRMRAINERGF